MNRLHSMPFTTILVLSALVQVPAAIAQYAPQPLWIDQFGTSKPDYARAVLSDPGGSFTLGETGGIFSGSGFGDGDLFLARYDHDGARSWLTQFGSPRRDSAGGLAHDAAGGVFAVGWMSGPTVGTTHPWIARIEQHGDIIWHTPLTDWTRTLLRAADSDGAGGFYAAGITSISLAAPLSGLIDALVVRFDSSGTPIWMRQFGTGDAGARAVLSDGESGAFVAGSTGAPLTGPISGLNDAWIARYDGDGNQLWLRQFGIGHNDGARALAPDDAGGVFVAGNVYTAAGEQTFITRYDGAGEQLWIHYLEPMSSSHVISGLAPDGHGGVFIAGHAANLGQHSDLFLTRYDKDGTRLWLTRFGTPQRDHAGGLASDHAGGAIMVGETLGSLGGPHAGSSDVFLARFPPGTRPPDGACCLHDGNCLDITRWRCEELQQGIFQGDNTHCASVPCPQPGACCFPTRCEVLSEVQCTSRGGAFMGEFTTCTGVQCPNLDYLPLPVANSTAPGGSLNGLVLSRTPVTYQVVYPESELNIPSGSAISALTWRIGSDPAYASWPPQPITWSSFDITVSTSLNPPGALSTTFAHNIAPDAVLARTGPLTLPTDAFPAGAAAPAVNNWGAFIEFTDPFIYTGGDLLITIRAGGRDGGHPPLLDTISVLDPGAGYGTLVQTIVASSDSAPTGGWGPAHIAAILYNPPPACYADCDANNTLNIDDFLCFINEFAQAQLLPHSQQITHYANCDGSTTQPVLTIDDFLCFINAFALGCP